MLREGLCRLLHLRSWCCAMKPDDPEMKVANIVPFGLRLQPELKRRVEEAAKANNRSLNAEISARLERSF